MKKFFTLIAVAAMAFAAQANQITVSDGGDYNANVPVYGYYIDAEGTMSQTIYPASMLEEMAGSKITGVKFYADGTFGAEGGALQLSLLEVDQLGFETATAVTGATVVAQGVDMVKGSAELEFVFDTPYEYNGGNLLVEVLVTEAGSYGMTYFQGTTTSYKPSFYHYYWWYDNNYTCDFLPKATFTYEPAEVTPEEPYMTGYWLVQVNANGDKIYTELFPGQNGDYVNVDDVTYPEFYEVCPFYFMINGVAYGAAEDMTLANLGDADQNPLTPNENAYYVGVGYSYTFGIHFIYDVNTMEFKGYSAYVAKGGRVDVDEVAAGKSVAGVRYFNLAGQEMQEANGTTIVVTTYTDGTTSTAKVIK